MGEGKHGNMSPGQLSQVAGDDDDDDDKYIMMKCLSVCL